MTEREVALVHDTRLSREARLMGLHIAAQGEEWIVVSTRGWQHILGRSPRGGLPKRQTLAAYASELELHDWIERKPGGSDSPRYRFLRGDLQSPSGHQGPLQSSRGTVERNEYSPPGGSENPAAVLQQDGRAAGSSSSKSSREQGVEAHEPLESIEPRYHLDPRVAEFLESEDLAGCRSALRDYLIRRVVRACQWGYLQTIRTWLRGGIGAPRGLHDIPPEDRTHLLASALNDLLSETASQERSYKASRGEVGQTGTLRSKLEYLWLRSRPRGDGFSLRGSSPAPPAPVPSFPEDVSHE